MTILEDALNVARKRVNLSLPEGVYAELEAWADLQGRPVANLAAFLVETAIREAKERGELPSKQQGKEGGGDRRHQGGMH
jgi:hypothetical protein